MERAFILQRLKEETKRPTAGSAPAHPGEGRAHRTCRIWNPGFLQGTGLGAQLCPQLSSSPARALGRSRNSCHLPFEQTQKAKSDMNSMLLPHLPF